MKINFYTDNSLRFIYSSKWSHFEIDKLPIFKRLWSEQTERDICKRREKMK